MIHDDHSWFKMINICGNDVILMSNDMIRFDFDMIITMTMIVVIVIMNHASLKSESTFTLILHRSDTHHLQHTVHSIVQILLLLLYEVVILILIILRLIDHRSIIHDPKCAELGMKVPFEQVLVCRILRRHMMNLNDDITDADTDTAYMLRDNDMI